MPNSPPTNLGLSFAGLNCLVVFPTHLNPNNFLLISLQISLLFMFTPALNCPCLDSFFSSRLVDMPTQIVFVALEDKKINLWVLSKGDGIQFKQNDVGGCDFLEKVMTTAFKDYVGRCIRIVYRTSRKPVEELTRNKESDISVQLSKGNKNSLRLLQCSIFAPLQNCYEAMK